jgi:hypothetical protein
MSSVGMIVWCNKVPVFYRLLSEICVKTSVHTHFYSLWYFIDVKINIRRPSWSSAQSAILVICSVGQLGHLLSRPSWSSAQSAILVICSVSHLGHLLSRPSWSAAQWVESAILVICSGSWGSHCGCLRQPSSSKVLSHLWCFPVIFHPTPPPLHQTRSHP